MIYLNQEISWSSWRLFQSLEIISRTLELLGIIILGPSPARLTYIIERSNSKFDSVNFLLIHFQFFNVS